MIPVSVCDVKSQCVTSLNEAIIDSFISVVQGDMGACVESSYTPDKAKLILTLAVCHLVELQKGGEVTSRRAANGSSINKQINGAGEGIRATSSGRTLQALDSNGCHNALFQSPVFFGVVGNSNRPGRVY